MATRFLNAKQIVEELGLYGSIYAVHRGVKRGELPPPTRYGSRFLWDRDRLLEHAREREGQKAPPLPAPRQRRPKGS